MKKVHFLFALIALLAFAPACGHHHSHHKKSGPDVITINRRNPSPGRTPSHNTPGRTPIRKPSGRIPGGVPSHTKPR